MHMLMLETPCRVHALLNFVRVSLCYLLLGRDTFDYALNWISNFRRGQKAGYLVLCERLRDSKNTLKPTIYPNLVHSHHIINPESQSVARSAPQDIQPPPPSHRLRRRLRVVLRNLDELHNGDLIQRDDLGLLDELEAEVEGEDDGDVNVRRDEGLGVPAAECVSVCSGWVGLWRDLLSMDEGGVPSGQ